MVENQTGLHMAVKQLGTGDPDPDDSPGANERFARVLAPNQR